MPLCAFVLLRSHVSHVASYRWSNWSGYIQTLCPVWLLQWQTFLVSCDIFECLLLQRYRDLCVWPSFSSGLFVLQQEKLTGSTDSHPHSRILLASPCLILQIYNVFCTTAQYVWWLLHPVASLIGSLLCGVRFYVVSFFCVYFSHLSGIICMVFVFVCVCVCVCAFVCVCLCFM